MASNRRTTNEKSIAQQDKELMNLQEQLERKETQLKQDYQRLQRDVKHNPYLQVAMDDYKSYFAKQKEEKNKQIKALTALLKHIGTFSSNENDTNDIKREIMSINRK
jgi:hypothetical protein